jgi:hypothetical protein
MIGLPNPARISVSISAIKVNDFDQGGGVSMTEHCECLLAEWINEAKSGDSKTESGEVRDRRCPKTDITSFD